MVTPMPPASCEQHLANLGQVLKEVWEQDTIDGQLSQIDQANYE